jgi:hypothetical protein
MTSNYKRLAVLLGTGVLTAVSYTAALGADAPAGAPASAQDRAIDETTRELATKGLGLKLPADATVGHKMNFAGVQAGPMTFTHRLDSRTFVAYDRRFSDTKATGVNQEPDVQLLKRNRGLLEQLHIPAKEIASEKVVQEKTQLGERDKTTGQVKLEPVQLGKKWVHTARGIDGLPVFSSRATIGWMPNGDVGFLEVHWPEIPVKVVEEGRRYRELVAEGKWHVPELKGARVESVTAGIIHSPAAATAMDVVPVIRVIYAPLDEKIGKKPVAYLDAEGKEVKMPRVFLEPPRESLKTQRDAPVR